MNTGKVVVVVLAGVAVGALIGVLFAPEKGSETRRKISDKGKDYSDAVKDKFNEFIDSISEKLEDMKGKAMAFAEDDTPPEEKLGKESDTD